MKLINWLTSTRPKVSTLQRHVRALVTQADAQTCEQWRLVNQARRARGVGPIAPSHPFRPHQLIDPCESESYG